MGPKHGRAMRNRDRWLSTTEVADRLGMGPEWVRRQIQAGRLQAVVYRTSSRPVYRVSESALAAFQRSYGGDAGSDSS
jgi:excisionase family DNA binding protein